MDLYLMHSLIDGLRYEFLFNTHLSNMIHIINLPHRYQRKSELEKELFRQGITEVMWWPGIIDVPRCKGTSRAHKQIIQWAKDNDQPEVTVFEDDIYFPAADGCDYYLRNKPEDFDLYLGGIYRGEIIDGKVDYFTGLHCYTVKAKFYDKFLSADESLNIDHAMAGLGDFYVVYPFAAIQINSFSDTEMAMSTHEGLLKDKLIYT
jgi:hypothetical protein